jgi:hypothetical protein
MRLPIIAPTLLCLAVGSVQAVEFAGIEVGGFASLGYVESSDNNYLADGSADGSWELNNVGINLGYQATDRLRFAAQVYASNLGNATEDARYEEDFLAPSYTWKNGGVALDLLFAQYQFADQIGVRLGRVKQTYGLYNEVRDIDAVRASATLPQSVYDDRSRESDFAVNGGAIYGSIDARGAGGFEYTVFGGTTDIPMNGTTANQYVTAEFELEDLDAGEILGGQVMWTTPLDGLRLGFSARRVTDQKAKVHFNSDLTVFTIAPGLYYNLPDENMDVTTDRDSYLLSLEYTWNDLVLQGEFQRIKTEQRYSLSKINLVPSSIFLPAQSQSISSDESTSEGWYLMASYRLGMMDVGGMASIYYSDIDNRDTKAVNSHQYDYGLFVRYDTPIDGLIVKAEGHYVEGAALLNVPDKQSGYFRATSTATEYWTYFVLKTAYSF